MNASGFGVGAFTALGGEADSFLRTGVGFSSSFVVFCSLSLTVCLAVLGWVKGTSLFVVLFFLALTICLALWGWAKGTTFFLGGASPWAFSLTREISRGVG